MARKVDVPRALLFGAVLAVVARPGAAAPGNVPAFGLVVESVDEASPPGKAGIQAGDVLIGWERAANPSSNPSPARGDLVTPMDLEEVCIEETQRGPLTLLGTRNGTRISFAIPVGFWDEFQLTSYKARQLPVHPRLEERDLERYLEGLRLVQSKDIDGAASVWRALATEWSKSGQESHAIWLRFRLAATLVQNKKYADAQKEFDAALSGARQLGLHNAASQILFAKARTYWRQYDLESSLRTFAECRRVTSEARGPSLLVAEALAEEGTMLTRSGRPLEGLESLKRSVSESGKVAPGGLTHGAVMVDVATCSRSVGDFEAAEREAREALAIMEKSHRSGGVWQASDTLASILADRGDFAAAETLMQRLLAISEKESKGTKNEAYAAGNLGELALQQGDLATAERYLLRDLALEEKVNAGTEGHAECLTNLGHVAAARGDVTTADGYYRRALEIQQKLSPDSLLVTNSLDGLGQLAMSHGDLEAATAYYERAIAILEKNAPDGIQAAVTLADFAEVAVGRGQLDRAQRLYERALTILEQLAPESMTCASALHGLGMLQRRKGHLQDAAAYLRRSVDALESQKKKLGGTADVRALFAAQHSDYYRDYIEVLIELGKKEDAFRTLERSRARELLTMLAERDLVFAADVPGDLERESKITDAAYDTAQAELKELAAKDQTKQVELIARLRDLRQKQEQIAERLKQASPRYAALQYPQPLDAAGARAALDSGTLLLSYSVGKDRTYLFAITSEGRRGPRLTVFTLSVSDAALRDSVKAFRKLIEWGESSPALSSRARSLYDALLKPADALIGRSDRVLILPDGPLHTLPWSALARSVKAGQPEYLIAWKPVHTAVSATVYAELKKQRRAAPPPVVDVVAFGDPKYPKVPERKTAVTRGEGEDPADALDDPEGPDDAQVRSVLRGGFRFDPLPATRQEVEQIVRLYAPKAIAYLGEDATEEKAKAIGKDVPLVHFACHAVLNERFPLDSALVFTIPEHPKDGQDNGLLQAWEIFEKVRIDADLVTLSACESGLGKEMGGEGLVGLTRAFQYAGARSVLASLWRVEDKVTGELMKRFYTNLRAGKSKDEALRLAQLDLVHSAEFAQPASWAAFQLNGDRR